MLKLENFWYIAAPSRALESRPIRREVEGEVIVLFRSSSGETHALEDRCRHRGMALSAGRVAGDCIVCPYHGWRYGGCGRLEHVPALCEEERLPRLAAKSYPVAERDGHLWVWIGAEAPRGEPFHFPGYGEPGWSGFYMHTRFEAPVEACLENFLDVPHTVFVHPGLFRGKRQKATRVRVRQAGDEVEAEFLDEGELDGFGPRLLFPRGTEMRHTDRFILPSISRVDYAFAERDAPGDGHAFIITSQCTQRAESVVDVTTAITWRLPLPRWCGPLVKAFLKPYCRKVIRQDVAMLAVQGRQWQRFGAGAALCHTGADLLGKSIGLLRRRAAEGLPGGPEVVKEAQLVI